MSEAPSIRNGIDLDELGRLEEEVRSGPVPVTVRVHDRWDDGAAFEGRGDTIDALGEVLDRDHHVLRLDVPVAFGGRDTGSAPGETLLAALGACIGGTLVQAAAVEDIDVDALEVSIEAGFDLRGTFDVGDARPGFSEIAVTLRLRADVNDDVLEQLGRESVRLSPSADSLRAPVPITVTTKRLADAAAARAGS